MASREPATVFSIAFILGVAVFAVAGSMMAFFIAFGSVFVGLAAAGEVMSRRRFSPRTPGGYDVAQSENVRQPSSSQSPPVAAEAPDELRTRRAE